jgi:hypothetical protein
MIKISDLDGISKTTNPRAKNEFTLHVPREYDYRFETDRREQVIDLIKRLWFNKMQQNIPVFGIP